jgi:hypothetical protein
MTDTFAAIDDYIGSSVIWGGNPALAGWEETLSRLVVSGW